jgi:hypothetical protein
VQQLPQETSGDEMLVVLKSLFRRSTEQIGIYYNEFYDIQFTIYGLGLAYESLWKAVDEIERIIRVNNAAPRTFHYKLHYERNPILATITDDNRKIECLAILKKEFTT